MNQTAKKIAVGSAFALFASTTLTGVASAAPATGSLGSSALGSLSPAFSSPYELAEDDTKCSGNYFKKQKMWEINWGGQHSNESILWNSKSFGGLTYIDPQYAGKTPAEELAAVKAYDANPDYKQDYHWWYPSRDMVSNGAELTLGFEDGDVVLGEVMVGENECPSVRWTHFPEGGEPVTTTPETFPEGAPAPAKPTIPSDSTGSLGSLFNS